jgi:hypothetical protein
MSYRWNERTHFVATIAKDILAMGCGVWLDGLAIPHFAENPMAWTGRRHRRKDPPRIELERLLNLGIERSRVFLSLAAEDFDQAPRQGGGTSKNWAVREYDYAHELAAGRGRPDIRVVDLGGVPETLRKDNPGRVLELASGTRELARRIAALAQGT